MNPDERARRAVLVDSLGLRSGESLVVVCDPERRAVAEGLTATARELGADAVLAEMSRRSASGVEPPRPVAAAMLGADVFVAPTSESLSHTDARRAASERGARGATMPGITPEVLVRAMNCDVVHTRARAKAAADCLTAAREVRITSDEGTDLTLSLENRSGHADDGDLTSPGAFGNLPFGEGFAAPVEGRTSGRIVFDGAVVELGEALVVVVEDGYVRAWQGAAGERFAAMAAPHGADAFAVAEIGIGTNDSARPSGVLLEDEKVLGTIHIAFGDNHTFGGTQQVDFHYDFVVLHPRVTVDGETVLEQGVLRLE